MIRWGLVGTGSIANKRVGSALVDAQNSRLLAVCDLIPESAHQFADHFHVPHVYASLEEMIADPNLDAIYLATPIFLHSSQAIQALKGGKHVLVEKPMALTVAEGEEMIQAARWTGKTLATAYYRRFYPKVRRAQQLITDGALGKVVLVISIYHTWFDPALGATGNWRAQKANAGGGVLWDMGSHRFDLLLGLFGMPTCVWATMETLAHKYEVEDTATVYMKLGNGAQCISTWQWSSQTWEDTLSIIGTNGKIIMEPMDSPNLTLFIGQGRSQERFDEEIPLPENVHQPMIQNFIDAVLNGEEPLESGKEGLKVNRILAAINESAATGCLVDLPALEQRNED